MCFLLLMLFVVVVVAAAAVVAVVVVALHVASVCQKNFELREEGVEECVYRQTELRCVLKTMISDMLAPANII